MLRILFALIALALPARAQLGTFCNADAACPCGPGGVTYDAGCPNSATPGASFHILSDTGEYANYLGIYSGTAIVNNLPPNSGAVICQGTTTHAPTPFGDGIRCVGGSMIRIATVQSSAWAPGYWVAQYPLAGQPTIAERGGVTWPGGYRAYFAVYRNAAQFCTPSTWNTTNAHGVVWS
jgi:hypothetical protein